eukprot:7450827-Alexandrium_andersonii.AAC.1
MSLSLVIPRLLEELARLQSLAVWLTSKWSLAASRARVARGGRRALRDDKHAGVAGRYRAGLTG